MCNLSGGLNNTPRKSAQSVKTWLKMDIGNTKEYNVKSYQVKMTIVKCTRVKKKVLKINCSQKDMFVYPTYMWLNKINLKKKLSSQF